jgi:hypothetical protein
MGWFGQLWRRLASGRPNEMMFVPSLTAPGLPWVGEPITPDTCYIELYVESLRLERARRFATRFNGVAYSFTSLPRQGEVKAQFAAVSKPEKLTELDPASLDRVITVSKQMMAPVAWRGGPLSLEIGLFSVKAGNLLTPVLEYVTKVSAAAGISFVGAVKPFLPLITEGMDLIAGQQGETELEVGIDTDISLTASGISAIIDAPKNSIDPRKLSVDPNDHKLLLDGKPLELGYCVFSIRRALQKADFGEIPELKEKYAALQTAIRAGKKKEAEDAMTAFRLTTIASPDLISSHARELVKKADEKLKEAFSGGGISATIRERPIEELSAIGLYD